MKCAKMVESLGRMAKKRNTKVEKMRREEIQMARYYSDVAFEKTRLMKQIDDRCIVRRIDVSGEMRIRDEREVKELPVHLLDDLCKILKNIQKTCPTALL